MKNHKDRISEKFSESAARYDQYADVQKHMASELLSQLGELRGKILDIGSGTGQMADQLCKKFPKAEVVGIDLAPGMVEVANFRFKRERLRFLLADGEALPFADNEFDAVLSSASLQWMDPVKVFAEAARVLKPGGELHFATFGPATLHELAIAGLSVNRFPGLDELEKQLSQYFGRVVVKSEIIVEEYASIIEVFDYLRKIGAQNPHQVRQKGLFSPRKMSVVINEPKPLSITFETLLIRCSQLT